MCQENSEYNLLKQDETGSHVMENSVFTIKTGHVKQIDNGIDELLQYSLYDGIGSKKARKNDLEIEF